MGVLAHIGMRTLEAMFFVGGLGSAVVLILTTIEDVIMLTESEDTVRSDASPQ